MSTNTSTSNPNQQLPSSLLIFIVFLIVFEILIMIGNGLVVYLVATRKRLHTNTNWIVLSLAVSDLAVSFAIIPSRIVCFRTKCDEILMKILYDIFIFVSLCNLCCLTLDRFIAVMKPLKYNTLITHKVVVKMIVISWMFPTIVFCIPLIWTYGYSSDITLRQTADKIFYLTQIIVFMCVPCLVMFAVYAYIFHLALDHAQRIQDLEESVTGSRPSSSYSNEARNTIKVFGVVYVLFVFCWIMSAYRTFTTFFQLGDVQKEVTMTSRLFLLFNSCVNPIVYALWKKDFRLEVGKMDIRSKLRKMSCCSQRRTADEDHPMYKRERHAVPEVEDGSSGSDIQRSNVTDLDGEMLTDPREINGNVIISPEARLETSSRV